MDSISRCMIDVVEKRHNAAAHRFLEIISTYRRSEDLINIGAYAEGTNPAIDKAIKMIDNLNAYLKQDVDEKVSLEESRDRLLELML
jgi:flagellum-specific ATP synthase